MTRVLLIEPDATRATALSALLPFDITRVEDVTSATRQLESAYFHVVIVNVALNSDVELQLLETYPGKVIRTFHLRREERNLLLDGLVSALHNQSASNPNDPLGLELGKQDGQAYSHQDMNEVQQEWLNSENMLMLGQVASAVAHDFNNIVSLVLAHADYLLSFPEAQTNRNELRHSLKNIRNAAEAAKLIVERLRTFHQSSDAELEKSSHDLSDIARNTVDMTKVRWHNHALTQGKVIDLELTVDDHCWVEASKVALIQILTNLVFNAVDAIAEKGTITVSTKRAGDKVLLSVSDTGIGMSADSLETCFLPFVSNRKGGTGIGLTIVKRHVEENGGTIDITSEPGQGTCLSIYLPFCEPADDNPPLDDHLPVPGRQYRILVIDDEPPIREILARMLGKLGHDILEAGSAEEAYRKIEGIDLVITDCLMPGSRGIDIAHQLLAVAPQVPVLFLSGDDDELNQPTPANVRGFIKKPFDVEDLREAIYLPDDQGASEQSGQLYSPPS